VGAEVLRAVTAARLEFAFSGLPLSLAVSVLLAAMTALMLWRAAPSQTMMTWFIALATINAARLVHYRGYRSQVVRSEADLETFDRALLIGCLAGGATWGSAALLFLPHALELQFFLAFVIAGVSSGAVTSLSVAPAAAYAFVVPCVMPLALRFLAAGDALHTVMGIMACFYMGVVMLVARRGHIQLTRMVASQLEAEHSRDALDVSEAQRRSSDERLRVAADAGQIGVWEWDLRTGSFVWDERMHRIYRVTPAADSNYLDVWRSRVHPADLDRVEDDLAQAVATSGHFMCEFRILWPTQEERYIKAAADVLRAPDGTALRIIGINLDITELKRLERIKSEFVSTVSHELRTPLTSIRGALGLVIRDTAGEMPQSVRELLSVADRNAARLGALIEDLLDAERLESGKLHFELQEQPLHSLIRHAVDANTPYAIAHQVTLELSDTLAESNVRVDGQRMLQVMTNLLSNAVKFSPRGGRVRVTLTQPGRERIKVSVIDAGPGVSPEFQSRIFSLFSQGDASDTRAKGGTGLGLAISKALIEHMGGVIGFLPNEGGGTTFFFELPESSAVSAASGPIEDGERRQAAREPSAP
jgi:signal transduction histidine kinase